MPWLPVPDVHIGPRARLFGGYCPTGQAAIILPCSRNINHVCVKFMGRPIKAGPRVYGGEGVAGAREVGRLANQCPRGARPGHLSAVPCQPTGSVVLRVYFMG